MRTRPGYCAVNVSAATRCRLSRTFGSYSLLTCSPLTGRTHQIRVHALHAGHPLAGDERYGDEAANKEARRLGLKRLFLHAQSIAFPQGAWWQPDEHGNDRHFTAPLADDLEAFLEHGAKQASRSKRARRR